MQAKGIFLSWIVVKDIRKAIEFYTKTVGFALKEFNEHFGWAELSGPQGTLLGLAQENSECGSKAGTNAVVTISVASMAQAIKSFQEKGVKLVGEVMEVPGHVKLQTFEDADGNTFQLVEELAF